VRGSSFSFGRAAADSNHVSAHKSVVNSTTTIVTRHRVTTSMYSLTCVCVTTPPQYGRNGTASLQITLRTQKAGVFAGMRSACGGPGALPLGSATHCHNNATRAPTANLPNSAQLGGIPNHSPKLHLGRCNSIGMWLWTDKHTDRQTHTQMRVTTIHFAWSTTHTKCNIIKWSKYYYYTTSV